ncbi:MAG: hypothetical protein CM1200mP2_40310 [Planctomycetaceae bacterium]|nr:MAG: hypothetical protein CM1200mP2_40310 [Planctomycetaceae bacterium]
MSFFWSGTVAHMFRRSSSNRLRGLASLLVAAVAFGSIIDHGAAQQKTAKPTAKKLGTKAEGWDEDVEDQERDSPGSCQAGGGRGC